jgi:hypothetical protein
VEEHFRKKMLWKNQSHKNSYQAILKDTICHFEFENDQLYQSLIYRFYEKDKNQGTVVGEQKAIHFYAVILLCRRNFFGHEVVFLKKVRCRFGDVVDDSSGKVTFRIKQLKFDGNGL